MHIGVQVLITMTLGLHTWVGTLIGLFEIKQNLYIEYNPLYYFSRQKQSFNLLLPITHNQRPCSGSNSELKKTATVLCSKRGLIHRRRVMLLMKQALYPQATTAGFEHKRLYVYQGLRVFLI